MTIVDSPRYPWRGLLVDSARHYLSVPLLERTIDSMAAMKLNTLHWHIVDAESFPYVSAQYPGNYYYYELVRNYFIIFFKLLLLLLLLLLLFNFKLNNIFIITELKSKAAYHPSATYSSETIAGLISYARDRGVRILPEFDTPGLFWVTIDFSLLVFCFLYFKKIYSQNLIRFTIIAIQVIQLLWDRPILS